MLAGASLAGVGALLLAEDGSPRDRLIADALAVRDGGVTGAGRPPGPPLRHAERDGQLSAWLGARVRLPDLSREGYDLMRVDLMRAAGQPRAQALYAGAGPAPLTIYLASSRGADAFALVERRRLRVCVWENDELAVVMAADLPRAALFRLASLTYLAMNA